MCCISLIGVCFRVVVLWGGGGVVVCNFMISFDTKLNEA